ncbi:hypothetical protein HS125_09165 [bacterium]|nr:hypothetical protein [bacterium]
MRRYCDDLAADGWRPRLMAAQVYAGTAHQDGCTLLAMRRFLQAVSKADASLAGAVLVGSFPEAMLVRSCNWRRNDEAVLFAGTPRQQRFPWPAPQLRTQAELVAVRCELVLCDLDGNWEERYLQPRTPLPSLLALFPGGVPAHGGLSAAFEIASTTFEDFFYVNDGQYMARVIQTPTGELLDVKTLDDRRDEECAPHDLAAPNPLAQPDIVVSRINARGVALSPRSDIRGASGEGLLDADGTPQRVSFARREDLPRETFVFDSALERRLLLEYFDRNHRYRKGAMTGQHRPAGISYALRDGFQEVLGAAQNWSDASPDDLYIRQANLADYTEWLTYPAVLRDIRAHSYEWGSDFGRCRTEDLEKATGPAWYWLPRGTELIPTLSRFARSGRANFYLYRSLWANGRLPDGASVYYHTGCDSISPGNAETHPYNHPAYSWMQGAESLLFYCNGLALVGRSKVFYDAPRGFYDALAQGKTIGEAWREYFRIESQAAGWREVGGDIGRKRSYFWSILGDWTLTLRPSNNRPLSAPSSG